ncbi:class I SAM-dependent methyltransferase [Paenibacillus lactis]|uniref:class I SAM-dependent methyltransferase n=1 Tax=Paenibacillus lactis TaxID=228574 RepID=UPI00369698FB
MKYDFDLDLTSKNSLSLILKKINPGSNVLEFGPAAGRMTKFLQQRLNCNVCIVEIDHEAAEKSSMFAEDAIIGNIEDFEWYDRYKHRKFDYIIFADVLEHLYNPKTVLEKSIDLLRRGGSIITSVPNIAHNAVIIDLLHNKFEYRKTGLLDDTHIRFFTYESLLQMISDCKLKVASQDIITKRVGETELNNFFDNLPSGVTKFLKNRDLGDAYQFVMELQPLDLHTEDCSSLLDIKTHTNYYYSQLYIDSGNGFIEGKSVRKKTDDIGVQKKYEFDVSLYNNIQNLRFDPINTNCIANIQEISCISKSGEKFIISDYITNADISFKNELIFLQSDPQVIFKSPVPDVQKVVITVEYADYEFESTEWSLNLINQVIEEKKLEISNVINEFQREIFLREDRIEKSELKISELQNNLDSYEVKRNELQSIINDKEKHISTLESEIEKKNEMLSVLEVTVENLQEELSNKLLEIEKIYKTRIGKLLKKIIK